MSTAAKRSGTLPAPLSRQLFGVVRPIDGRGLYANPPLEFRRWVTRGALHPLATGYYAVVPAGNRHSFWLPSLEAAAYGIAAADYGAGQVVLMGLSAARVHGALPRALATAIVAVPKNRPVLQLRDREGRVVFVRRDTNRLDAERVRTDLGTALVTTVEQTILDLAHRPSLGGLDEESTASVAALWPRCDPAVLDDIAGRQRLKAALARARTWADR